MSGMISLPHACPKCESKKAVNFQELSEIFGFRNMPGGVRNQSWCRSCRLNKRKA